MAGVVVEKGSGVTKFDIGDEVYANIQDSSSEDGRLKQLGTQAEYIVVEENLVAKKPENISFEEAASLPLAVQTAMEGCKTGGFKEGQTVFEVGGAGGVGTLAVQLAKHFYEASLVVATTSTAKVEFVRSLGADKVVDYTKTRYEEVEDKFDLLYDTIGYIAMYATLASRDVDCCLIPESPFYLKGPGGLFDYIEKRLKENGHMVIVIAEGAGQQIKGVGGVEVHKAAAKRQDNEDVYNEVDGEESLRLEFMFPFCVEDYDVVGICCHIDEEHAVEVKNGELGRQVPLMDKIDDKEKGYYGIEEFVANRLEVVSRLSWLKGVRLEDKASAAGVAANAYWRKKGCVDWWEKLDASTRKNVFRVILGKSAKSLGLSLLFAEHLGESIKK